MNKIKAILFDLDGVLVDAKQWHFEAFNKALIFYGYPPISHADHLVRYDGLPTRKKLALLAKIYTIPESQFENINSLKQKFTIDILREKCTPNPVHVMTIEKLKEDGYHMAVCSNSVRASVDLLLGKAELLHFFDFTLSNEDVKHPKPCPEIYLAAMQRLGILATEALVLEDNINGILAARESNAHLIEIKNINEVNYENITHAIDIIEKLG